MPQQSVRIPDLRDERGRNSPGVFPAPGAHRIERCPTGGMVDPSVYHDKGRFNDQTPQTQPLPLHGNK